MSQDSQGPLSHIRVVEAATMVMVPCAGTVLSDYGAEVIKVEPPTGDLNRRGHLIPGMPVSELEYTFLQDNRNKKSIVLDLKNKDALAVLRRLIESADVFLTNYRTDALDRLGIDYETLKSLNPKLIFAHGTGYGDHGPEAKQPGYDVVSYWSRSGLEATFFPEEGSLSSLGYATGDHPSGMSLFAAVMLALFERERTGKGQRVSTSLIANGAWSNSSLISAELTGATFQERKPRHQARTYAAVYYRSKDDRVFKFAVVDHNKSWPGFARGIGREEWILDPQFADVTRLPEVAPEVIRHCDQLFAQHDLAHWKQVFAVNDIPFSVLSDYSEVVSDPQMLANDVFLDVEYPEHGTLRSVNSPFHLDETSKVSPKPAPTLGQDRLEILGQIGLADDEILRLEANGAFGQAT